jgi:uncharacterized repeat protein (TIGR01451 family)
MNKFRIACLIACVALCLATFGWLLNRPIASAQSDEEEAPPPEETFELQAKYPALSGPADTSFEFEVGLSYRYGKEAREFELRTTGPEGWLTYVCESSYKKDTRLTAIRLETYSVSETVLVVAIAPFWLFPEPGDYTIQMEAVSEDLSLKDSIDLTATITARYNLAAATTSGRLNTKATAGKESRFSITVTNTGTATLDKVTFSSTKPSGIGNEEWKVTFDPEEIEAVAPLDEKEIEVTVKAPSKTIAGDYMTTLQFDAEPKLSTEPPKLEIRVTVSTPTKWGWIGAGIIAAVIAGLVLGFRQWGRR